MKNNQTKTKQNKTKQNQKQRTNAVTVSNIFCIKKQQKMVNVYIY